MSSRRHRAYMLSESDSSAGEEGTNKVRRQSMKSGSAARKTVSMSEKRSKRRVQNNSEDESQECNTTGQGVGTRKFRSTSADEQPNVRDKIARSGRAKGKTVEDKIPEDDEDDSEKENNEEGGDSDSSAEDEQNEEMGEELEEVDHVKFFKEYTTLIKAARRLGDDLNVTDDFAAGNSTIIGNIESASRLARNIGSDPSKAATAFSHALAITETACLNVKKCGNVSSFFSIERYLDTVKNLGVREDGEYDVGLVHQMCIRDVRRCTFKGYHLVSLLGNINISADEPAVENAEPEKKKRSVGKRANFDDTAPATQHQVVNSQVRKNAVDSEKDSLTESLRKAEQLKKLCSKKKKKSVSLFEYGLQKPDTIQSFVAEVFTAAVLTRDGCASLTTDAQPFPDVGTCGLTNKLDAKLQVAAADPPDVTEDNFELNRKQHIVSLNAKAIRELLAKGKAPV